MLSIFFLILAAAPASGPYSREQLDAVNRVGLDEFDRMEDRCLPTAIGTPAFASPDIEAELAFFRMAELIRLVILNYPYAPGRADQSQHSDDVSQAVQGFERAYLCHPGWEQRHYLNSAMTLLEARIRQIRDVERRALTESEEVILQQALLRLRALRGQLRAPAACREPSSCPPMVAPPTPVASPTTGYRAKYMDLLSLRFEFGGGLGTKVDDSGGTKPRSGVFLFSVAPGVRFLAGKRRRHVLGLGFRWSVTSFKDADENDFVHQMVTRFEYGIRAHPKWFSLHAAFEPGLQARPANDNPVNPQVGFGNIQVGGSGALCTWNEAFCVRFGGYFALAKGDADYIDGRFLGAGFDLLRVADNILRREDE
jgi:hypothetical protein